MSLFVTRHIIYPLSISVFTLVLLLAACNKPIVTPTPAANGPAINAAGSVTATITTTVPSVVSEIAPYPAEQAIGPIRIQIPAIGLDAPVIAMGWKVAVINGKRTTEWNLPEDKAGWHINSAGAGAAGNTIISGRQVGGAAVFAPLALGSVAPGQQVLLTDGDGITFVYKIAEVTDPIPLTGATPDEVARAATYFAPTKKARLTLVTGWPDFTTTHRIFAVADFVGVMH